MNIRKAKTQHQIDAIYELYMRAFPKEERKPFALMLEKCKEGSMELLCIEDDEQRFLGLAIFVFYEDLALLDYFAIADVQRGIGIGTKALRLLQKYYEGKRFFLEIEDMHVVSDNKEERIRRRSFYLRNGMKTMPFTVDLFGVIMEVLTYQTEILPEEYMALYEGVFSHKVLDKVKIHTIEN